MIVLRARFDGRVLVPMEPVDLPTGQLLELQVKPVDEAATVPPLVKLAELANEFAGNSDAPTDAAAQHNHYLYGTPKRM